MYKFILIVLIAVINAQFITITQKEINSASRTASGAQDKYIEEAMKDKLNKCMFTCIKSGCGRTFKTHACLYNLKLRYDCYKSCGQSANDVKQTWKKKLII